jgi:hypothetical protein
MGHFEGFFEGEETFLTSEIVLRVKIKREREREKC